LRYPLGAANLICFKAFENHPFLACRLAASFAAKYGIFGIKAVDLQELPFTSEIAFRL
jgi:hypothetical protein